MLKFRTIFRASNRKVGMKKIFFSVILLSSLAVFGQQEAHFTQYAFNQLYVNPAFAGVSNPVHGRGTEFRMIHRTQWLGYSPSLIDQGGSPTTQIFSTDAYLQSIEGGVGLTILTDKIALQRFTAAQLSLSKHITIKPRHILSIGLQGSVSSNRFDAGWRPPDNGTLYTDDAIPHPRNAAGDILMDQSAFTQGFADAAAGIWYETPDYYAGIGMNRLLDKKFDFNDPNGTGGFRKHMYISAGYRIDDVYNWVFMPTLLIKSSLSKGSSFDLGGVATYKNDMWGGLNFRQGDSFGILLGKSFKTNKSAKIKQLRLGYALDLTIKGAAAKGLTSHEIMLTYALPRAIDNLPPAIHTPRFQF